MRYLRWIFLAAFGVFAVASACVAVLCVFNVFSLKIGPHKVTASDDVIWLLPWENGRYWEEGGFAYEGASVSASENGGLLTVNGKFYGRLAIGDSVDVSRQGVVLVNDQPRQPR